MYPPYLAVTMGDPAGIGPEVIACAWGDAELHGRCRPVVLGHPAVMERAVLLREVRRGSGVRVVGVDRIDQIPPDPHTMPVLRVTGDEAADVEPATIDPRGGQAAYDAIVTAARLALAGDVAGLVTLPIHKAALWRAGRHYPGHTELLAELCGVDDFAMLLYLGHSSQVRGRAGLGVVHVTLHMALREVFEHLSGEAIVAKARLVRNVMRTMKRLAGQDGEPRIGVCGLNPHASDEGLFGDEEQRIIRPAVEVARQAGLQIEGPLPADALLVQARDGRFDGVVAMYHDQGHIALKLLGMHHAVNVTLGLPIVRTSVAHGTAFDLAWQGRAEITSLIEACRVAAALAEDRQAAE